MAQIEAPQQPAAVGKETAQDRFYDQYSPHHELPYSSLGSFVFHFCLMLLLPLLASALVPQDTMPPAVEVVAVTDSQNDAGEPGDGLPEAGPLEASENSDVLPPTMTPTEDLNQVVEAEVDETDIEKLTEEIQQEVTETTEQGQQIAASAAEQLANATSQLNENLAGGQGGSGSGSGARGERAARWILHFDTRNAKDYLEQFGGLGAEIAFPQRGDRWQFFDLTQSPPASESKDLSGENRIYWVDEDGQSVSGVCSELGISTAEFMIAFLPIPLENEMLEMELAYQGAANEDAILQTEFKVVPRGGGFGVIVVDQKLK